MVFPNQIPIIMLCSIASHRIAFLNRHMYVNRIESNQIEYIFSLSLSPPLIPVNLMKCRCDAYPYPYRYPYPYLGMNRS